MIIPYIMCCSPVLTDLAHACAKFVFQYVTGCVGGKRSLREVQENLNFSMQTFRRFDILPSVSAGCQNMQLERVDSC